MKAVTVPEELRFAITRKCDGQCRHCYNQSGKDQDLLTADDFIRMLDEVYLLNPKLDRMTITGGEPLLEKEKVLQVARFAHLLGMRIRLVTRGWELSESVCAEMKEAGITRVQIGLDSSGKQIFKDGRRHPWDTLHSWLRGDSEGFQKAVLAIKRALAAGLDVSIRFSLCESNFPDLINTYQFVSSLGVSKFKLRVLFPDGRARKKLFRELISGEKMAEAQYQLIQASGGNPTLVEVTQPCFFKIPIRANLAMDGSRFNAYKEACPCGTSAAYIDANGDVKYCLFDEQALGNVLQQSFLSVWNSEKVEQVRKLRCPLDRSGNTCSSFKLLYEQFNEYSSFMTAYANKVHQLSASFAY